MAEREATSLACRALTVQKSGRDDFPVGAGAYVLPTMPSASIERVKCLDEHEFRKLLGFRREPSEESNGLAVRHVWGMVPEDPPNSARPPKQTLLRGSSAGLDRARLGPVRFVKAGGGSARVCRGVECVQQPRIAIPPAARQERPAATKQKRHVGEGLARFLVFHCSSLGVCLLFRDETAAVYSL